MLYLVFALAMLLAFLAERGNKMSCLVLLILVLSCFVGLRSRSVGIDTDMYYQQFERLSRGIFSPNVEIGFQLICYPLLKIMKTEHLILLFSLITNCLIMARLWSLREKASFFLMSMLYIFLLYPETANIMRQYLAIAVVFYASIYVEKKRPVVFSLWIVVAIAIHRSALLGLSYYPLYFWVSHKDLNKKAMLGLSVLIVAPMAVAIFLQRFSGNLSKYLSGKIGIGLLYPTELAILTLFALLHLPALKRSSYPDAGFTITLASADRDPKKKTVVQSVMDRLFRSSNTATIVVKSSIPVGKGNDAIFIKYLTWIYLFGIVLCAFGYYQSSLYRLGLYFMIYEVVFIPYVCTHGTYRTVFLVLYGVLIAYLILQYHLAGWSGLNNYLSWIG